MLRKFERRALVLLTALLVMTSVAAARGNSTVSGTVVDAHSRHPVAGVKVEVYSEGEITKNNPVAVGLTGKNGLFNVSGLPSRRLQVVLVKMGYSEEVLSGLVTNSNERTIIGEPIALHTATTEDMQKMACNRTVRPEETADVYVVCGSK